MESLYRLQRQFGHVERARYRFDRFEQHAHRAWRVTTGSMHEFMAAVDRNVEAVCALFVFGMMDSDSARRDPRHEIIMRVR